MTTETVSGLRSSNKTVFALDHDDKLVVTEGGIVVTAGGNAFAAFYGVFAGDTSAIRNDGVVSGQFAGIGLSGDATLTIGETGTVRAPNWGVMIGGTNSPTIVNHGEIVTESPSPSAAALPNAAVHIYGPASTKIVNTGTIKAGDNVPFAINSEGQSRDVVVNKGKIIGDVALGDGKDSFDTSKGKVVGTIDGGAGSDKITGSALADKLFGGDGSDTFVFQTKPNKNAIDHIGDFEHGHDKLVLSKSLFKLDAHESVSHAFHDITAGTKVEQADDHILYNHKNGYLYYDADGKGGHAPVHFATLDHHPSLTSGDILMA